jgi:hypothetical protein
LSLTASYQKKIKKINFFEILTLYFTSIYSKGKELHDTAAIAQMLLAAFFPFSSSI